MTRTNTISRLLHDVGAAAWFGGSLAGAVALNGAAGDVKNPAERTQVAVNGWARWAPVSAAAIGAHLLGGLGIILDNRGRIQGQHGVTAGTIVKSAVTVAAMGTTAYSGVLGARLATANAAHTDSATEPSSKTPDDVAAIQQQLRVLQWVTPVLTAVVIGIGSLMGEQQRPAQVARGAVKKVADKVLDTVRN
ncbi:hypothetical protein ABLG96_03385 [Nakamurella sp. A5-74]|uniref:ABC-type Mn/Zn transport systems, ATPase component n=1 Tax=Nakamurella sp. A5-74 TaxID=3158264 RepID=A0AAU8DQW5_9ACTN